jgi:superfamily II DNA or RNA helicase/diadenosine tetraphosphate (Ap4A) HIT family hydrolase/HKD family nuclease
MNARDTCPFCSIAASPSGAVVARNDVAFAMPDGYPVNPGHTLVIPHRHVATWFETTAEEQRGIMELIAEVRQELDRELHPDGYNIGINVGEAAGQTVMHLHVHVIPRFRGDVDDPCGGVRYVIPSEGNYRRRGHIPRRPPRGAALSSGGVEDPFIAHVLPLFRQARDIAILAAFVQGSGVERLEAQLESSLERGARVRLLTGDYLNITQARALRHLLDLMRGTARDDDADQEPETLDLRGTLEVRVVEIERLRSEALGRTFHPKAWIFIDNGSSAAFVGSSNLSRPALEDGVEWNLRVERRSDPEGFDTVVERFERWWERGRLLDEAWLDGYSDRARTVARRLPAGEVEDEAPAPPPELWPVQREALEQLRSCRVDEQRERALVVMATGLGKTVLAASDVRQLQEERDGRMPRVLFIAHRVEILRQAARTFRVFFADASFGWFAGPASTLTGDVVFASVMKLGRPEHLEVIERRAFDYVVVDEVHHADARTYRRILGHLEPRFLLGLTATPERADAGDIHGLFDDNVAFRADIGVGIERGHLVPFDYFGLKDTIDYRPIPWRNRRFDLEALAAAAQTRARMETLWKAWSDRPGQRTLVFCCSIAHAEYARDWLEGQGMRVVAVHSGGASSDRAESLDRLAGGELDAICTVDIFNEGVDIPSVDRVVMLRPTESPVVFLQQLGRGLRVDPSVEKLRLTVIDFVGNHRVFLDRVRTLLSLAPAERVTSIHDFVDGQTPELPEGCDINIEPEAIDLMRLLLPARDRHAVVRRYRELRAARGERPRLGELARTGYNPGPLSRDLDGWFEFVRSEGDLTEPEATVLGECRDWLFDLERRESMTKSFKMVAVQAMLESGSLTSGMPSRENAERSYAILHRSPELFQDLGEEWQLADQGDLDLDAWQRYWERWPLSRWAGEGRSSGRAWFRLEDGRFTPRFTISPAAADTLFEMTAEIVDYRLARYRRNRRGEGAADEPGRLPFECKVIHTHGTPILKLPSRERFPAVPTGEADVTLPDGAVWRFRFVKFFCNVARPVGTTRNRLADLMRSWFGPDAGAPGTDFRVLFSPGPDGWRVEPASGEGAEVIPLPRRGQLTAFPTLRAAAGWQGTAATEDGIEPEGVRLPGSFDRETDFAVRASGRSMEGLHRNIRDGDWLVMRWSRGVSLGGLVGRVALVGRGDPEEGRTYHVKRVVRKGRGFELVSDNPEVPPVAASADDEPMALVLRTIRPEDLGPERGALLSTDDLARAFDVAGSPLPPWSRVDGHLFFFVEGEGQLSEPDRVRFAVPDRREAETAFVLARGAEPDRWQYLGVGRWLEDGGAWEIPDVDFATWRRLGHGRGASRRLEEEWLVRAGEVAERVLREVGEGRWIEAEGKRCRIVGRASKGGLRIDGGDEGFEERTVSLLDIGWALKARELAGRVGRVPDEGMVNELRYLDGTPKGSTRWIDTGWALVVTEE